VRHGTTSLFEALEAQSGRVVGDFHARHRSVEFRKFLERIEAAVLNELDVHLILNNHGTHKTPLIHWWLARHPRFHVHFTPTSASWVNLVERWFANHPSPFLRAKTADEILASISRFCKRIGKKDCR
jgi:hypothetical protein